MHTAESLVSESIPLVIEIAIAELKRYKSPDTNQILAELISQGVNHCSEIHKLIKYIWNKEQLPQQ
jgi:hypothetical protein